MVTLKNSLKSSIARCPPTASRDLAGTCSYYDKVYNTYLSKTSHIGAVIPLCH